MNGKKSTYARKFAFENKHLALSEFTEKVRDLNENDIVKKKILREYRIFHRQAGMPDSADPDKGE